LSEFTLTSHLFGCDRPLVALQLAFVSQIRKQEGSLLLLRRIQLPLALKACPLIEMIPCNMHTRLPDKSAEILRENTKNSTDVDAIQGKLTAIAGSTREQQASLRPPRHLSFHPQRI
jgi:hypothetical protein